MLFKIALKNIFASFRRSILTLVLSAAGTVFLIWYVAMMNGQYSQMIKDSVEIYTGYIQVTAKGYVDAPSYDRLILNSKKLKKEIQDHEDIQEATIRFESYALFSSDKDSVGAQLIGILPEPESKISRLKRSLVEGRYLTKNDKNTVYMGKALAKKLGIEVGEKIAYISSAVDRSMAADYLMVKGLFKTGINEMDGSMALVNKAYMDENFLSEDLATHIVILPKITAQSEEIKKVFQNSLRDKGVEVHSWRDLLEGLLQIIEVDRAFAYVIIGLFFAVVFFVIMIYSMISIYSRKKEIGIMRAIGTKPMQIALILLNEAFVLGLAGVILGAFIGGYLSWYWEINPIQLKGFEETIEQYGEWGYAIEPVLRTVFSLKSIIYCCAFVLVLNLLAVVYPVFKINKMEPIEAINE